MKRFTYLFAALLSVVAISCNKDKKADDNTDGSGDNGADYGSPVDSQWICDDPDQMDCYEIVSLSEDSVVFAVLDDNTLSKPAYMASDFAHSPKISDKGGNVWEVLYTKSGNRCGFTLTLTGKNKAKLCYGIVGEGDVLTPGEDVLNVTRTDPGVALVYPVDLGLNAKWANVNIGAPYPRHPGVFFWRGGTEPIKPGDKYDEDYLFVWDEENEEYIGIVDLDTDKDPAWQIIGVGWTMPTLDDVYELKNTFDNKEDYSWETIPGVGARVTYLSTGASVFFPFTGDFSEEGVFEDGNTAALYFTQDQSKVYAVTGSFIMVNTATINIGRPVRAVNKAVG